MSHYTLGTGSNPQLHKIARAANKERSAAFRAAFTGLSRAFARLAAPRRLPQASH
ncbi:hypothetical protein EL18_00578 [Nitratireductor basaltis]|uniref:Uncharacterized protein n=3 Tax=Nitratireductor TaxID=245876 RepID=A0A084U9C6_9HYPH|nr:hypothetical protein EL18_00578 [Nitratireductor basaltis]